MRTGFANGCFDGLHEGHKNFLRECRKHCDVLYVAINSDESIRRMKGGEPLQREDIRAQHLLHFADGVNVFDSELDLFEIMKAIKPDVIFKSEEYQGKTVTGGHLAPIRWIPRTPGISSTELRNGLRDRQ